MGMIGGGEGAFIGAAAPATILVASIKKVLAIMDA